MFVEPFPGPGIHTWIARKGKVVGSITAGPEKTVAFDRLRNTIGHPHRVTAFAPLGRLAIGGKCLFHFIQGTDKGRRVPAIKTEGYKTAMLQMGFKALKPLSGAQFGALLNTPAVGNHHRHHGAAVFRPPPAGNPVAAPLLFGGTV